jgi:GNAT superfamily N-acetyltransferase
LSDKHPDANPAYTVLPWDSSFWGVRIASVNSDTMTPETARHADEWALHEGVDCLYFLARSDDAETAFAAEDAGFRLVDVRVQLTRASEDVAWPAIVRESKKSDLAELQRIARSSHEITRFYADPRFPRERCADLYELWITRSCEGWADAVLVAHEAETPLGYVSCHEDEGGAARIGLIAVDARARVRGFGRALVLAAFAWSHGRKLREISVVTQGRNVAAQRLFERCGFRTCAVGLWFHKWYDR